MPNSAGVTQLLADAGLGDQGALDALFPLVYNELRRLADAYLRNERQNHTLQPTALVHEAYLRLVDQSTINWQNRAHFFSVAAQVMRHILVDHARNHQRLKRGGPARKLSLDEAVSFFEERDINLVALDEALTDLEKLDQQQSRIVELRFFGGLTIEEMAEVLKISPATVSREWSMAKMWLHRALTTS
ncbi:MAG TPA: sigma-70 family RNA polymerase sigma factor [Pyrinomonadaceae bacterium]|nr:sigma-70 family RNA polymerase sigma factor [Pyrinomonadaceae bacterium]